MPRIQTTSKRKDIKKADRRQIYPKYSKSQVDKAAHNISLSLNKTGFVSSDDEVVIENWRASHTHVINTWQIILRQRTKGKNIIFVQRLKRKNTIYDKLKRFPKMQLSRMHDIAGCRLIFKNEKDIEKYRRNLHSSQFNHLLKENECKNYIANPKSSGYRGIHDVYLYRSKRGRDRSDKWNNLLIEIQYRTIYQHAWATAVEVADYVTDCRAKFSEGNEKQQEFFKLASEIIARAYENQKSCKYELSNLELISDFKKLNSELGLIERLKQLKKISADILRKNVVIHFFFNDKEEPDSQIYTYNSLPLANIKYFELENKFPSDDIVLVRTSDKKISKSIEEAYRNYFADTKDFTLYIEEGIKKLSC